MIRKTEVWVGPVVHKSILRFFSLGDITSTVGPMEEIDVWVGPVVHKSNLRFYIMLFFPRHQVACWM